MVVEKLVTDQGIFELFQYTREEDLESDVLKNIKVLFGQNCLFVPQTKLKSYTDMPGGVPDGLLIDIDQSKMFIIEIELSSHPIYDHIAPQLAKFKRLFKNSQVREDVTKVFYESVKVDKNLSQIIKNKTNSEEIYVHIKKIIDSSSQNLVLIVDDFNPDIEMSAEDFSASRILELKRYQNGEKIIYKIFDNSDEGGHLKPTRKDITVSTKIAFSSVEEYLEGKNSDSLDLYRTIREKVMSYGNVKEFFKTNRIYFRDETKHRTFMGINCYDRRGRVLIVIYAGKEFDDSKNISKPWGEGSSSRWFYINSREELEYALSLIEQSFNRK